MQTLSRAAVANWLPVRAAQAHKGDFGRVLVIAGSRELCGAGLLCAKSALLTGAGLVYWALPESKQPAFAAAVPEVITLPLPETKTGEIAASAWGTLTAYAERFKPTVSVIGPGMGSSPLLPKLLTDWPTAAVIDADGLTALAARPKIALLAGRPTVFTPHPGEMARLLGGEIATSQAQREEQVRAWTKKTGSITVLKGFHTLVAACEKNTIRVWKNTTGNVALAKAGTGDVLAGVIAGLWAQLGPREISHALQAALCGVYIHGLAGETAAAARTVYGVLASDVAQQVPVALKQILKK